MTIINNFNSILIFMNLGVHIKDMVHERAWVVEDVFKVEVKVICECRDREHSLVLKEALASKYGSIYFNGALYPDHDMAQPTAVFAGPPLPQTMTAIESSQNPSVQQNVIDLGTAGASQMGSQQVTGSFHPSPVGGYSPFPQAGGSAHPSQIQGSQHPSQQMGGSQFQSQQIGASQHPSQAICEPCGSVQGSQQGSMHPSQQIGGSFHPSCAPCGSVQVGVAQTLGGSVHPSQQIGSVQASIHSSQVGGQYPPTAPPLGEQSFAQAATQIGSSLHPSQQSNRPIEIGIQKQFSNCCCKKRGAPGDYQT